MLIYRRLALLTGARADIQPMARTWAVVIYGHIGMNNLRVLESFILLKLARRRALEINKQHKAFVESVDQILYPLSFISSPLDSKMHGQYSMPKETTEGFPAYSKVEDVFELSKLRKRIERSHALAHQTRPNLPTR